MHRAIGRAVRGTVRKWRENEVPTVAGEEVRKKKENHKEKFAPPRYTVSDAIGWTAGLVITYEIAHRRARNNLCCDVVATDTSRKCPLSLTEAVTQPLYAPLSTAEYVIPKATNRRQRSTSIDATPFLQENLLIDSDFKLSSVRDDGDEDGFSFSQTSRDLREAPAKKKEVPKKPVKPEDPQLASYAEKIVGNTLSLLGAFEFLRGPSKMTDESTTDPPLTAMDLLKKGDEYSSGRTLYNLGVAYARNKDTELAREYYKRASEVGHPLATYNYAISILHEGKISEGIELMKISAAHGVPEAQAVINDLAP